MRDQSGGSRKYQIGFSISGSIMTIIFLALVNYITSPHYPWFIYPAFAALWWPLLTCFSGLRRAMKALSATGSVLIILFAAAVNYVFSPGYIWFFYPAFAILWWPLSIFLARVSGKAFACVGSLYLIAFLCLENYLDCPQVPWVLYTVLPILWWPAALFLKGKMLKTSVAVIGSAVTIAYYTVLNILLSPAFPWAVFPAFAMLWWPLSTGLGKKTLVYACSGTALTGAFFITLNMLTTPNAIWAVYPIFAVLWWPLSVYYFGFKKRHCGSNHSCGASE